MVASLHSVGVRNWRRRDHRCQRMSDSLPLSQNQVDPRPLFEKIFRDVDGLFLLSIVCFVEVKRKR
jgi:hypothetical protein